jgi:hypothetical protein
MAESRKVIAARYYAEHRDAILANKRKRHAAHPEKTSAVNKRFRKNHRDDVDFVLCERLSSARKRALSKGLAFNITKKHLRALSDAQPFCAVTKQPFDLATQWATISLDRIDAAEGYVIGNVRLVWWIVNTAMGNWGEGPLHKMVDAFIALRQPPEEQ